MTNIYRLLRKEKKSKQKKYKEVFLVEADFLIAFVCFSESRISLT